jgi:small subunit ribosomal protein S20
MEILMRKKKEVRKNIKKHAGNKAVKESVKISARELRKAADANNAALAEEKFGEISRKIDRAARKGIINKNAAARKKSSLAKKINSIKPSAQAE